MQDGKNKNSIWDDALNTLQSIINKINSFDNFEVDPDYSIRFFEQKFLDDLAGGFVEITLQAEDDLGACEINDIITEDETLIERLEEAIRNYEAENEELAVLLKDILHRLSGEVVE